jgi:ferritin-like metal-binding protein YciE
MESDLRELLSEHLNDAYNAERQAMRCLQTILRGTTNASLQECINVHITETDGQIERIQMILAHLRADPVRRTCEAIRGLIETAEFELAAWEEGALKDVMIVNCLLRIEHYEIAAYVSMIAIAQAIEQSKAVEWLQATLAEEQNTAKKLTDIFLSTVLPLALDDDDC